MSIPIFFASWYSRITLPMAILCLHACALTQTDKPVVHGFSVENMSTEIVSNITVQYGPIRREFCKRGCAKGGGSFYGVYLPIQPEMQVTWQTADGQTHQAQVVVKAKVKDLSLLEVLFLEFRNESLTIKQGARFTSPGLVGLDESPLYP